jgi:hypothetical protein
MENNPLLSKLQNHHSGKRECKENICATDKGLLSKVISAPEDHFKKTKKVRQGSSFL